MPDGQSVWKDLNSLVHPRCRTRARAARDRDVVKAGAIDPTATSLSDTLKASMAPSGRFARALIAAQHVTSPRPPDCL